MPAPLLIRLDTPREDFLGACEEMGMKSSCIFKRAMPDFATYGALLEFLESTDDNHLRFTCAMFAVNVLWDCFDKQARLKSVEVMSRHLSGPAYHVVFSRIVKKEAEVSLTT